MSSPAGVGSGSGRAEMMVNTPKWLRVQRCLIAERYGTAALTTNDLNRLMKLYLDRRSVIMKRMWANLREQGRAGRIRGVCINPAWLGLQDEYWQLLWENRALQDNIYHIKNYYSLQFRLVEPEWYQERIPRVD